MLTHHLISLPLPLGAAGNDDILVFGLIICGAIAIALVAAILGRAYEKNRTSELARVAEELGFAFSASDSGALLPDLQRFDLVSHGRAQHISNVMSGVVEDVEIAIFDYRYTTGSGKNRKTHRRSVVSLKREGWGLPGFHLRPESVFTKIGQVFGYQDCDFPEHPEFNRLYVLRGTNQIAIRTLFTEDVLGFYESQSGLSTEGCGDVAIVYRPGKRLPPDQVPQFYDTAWAVAQLLKTPSPERIRDFTRLAGQQG
jgi:hypothetical protein